MAKQKFPGKALRLNQRERAKFNESVISPDFQNIQDIRKGLKLFRSIFGDSEEEDFEGFTVAGQSETQQRKQNAKKIRGLQLAETTHCNGTNKIFFNGIDNGIGEEQSSHDDSSSESCEVTETIALYADSIAEEFQTDEGKDNEACSSRLPNFSNLSPKKEKAKRKIEKILRSQWDDRLKIKEISKNEGSVPSYKNILREPRFNLNSETLEMIRTPSSSQNTLANLEDDVSSGKCTFCCCPSSKLLLVYSVSSCDSCNQFLYKITSEKSVVCIGGNGGCQLVGLPSKDRCKACWLLKILLSCAIPALVHDTLRKLLPETLREKIPTSLAQGEYLKENCDSKLFGKIIELPGGWKRQTDHEVTVISPTGEQFTDIVSLSGYLEMQSIQADANFLFGSSFKDFTDTKVRKSQNFKQQQNKVVTTNLPGGWSRQTKWDNNGILIETYVFSPYGKAFKTSKELQAYFLTIGKIDDMNKYFPLEDTTTLQSSKTSKVTRKSGLRKNYKSLLSKKQTTKNHISKSPIPPPDNTSISLGDIENLPESPEKYIDKNPSKDVTLPCDKFPGDKEIDFLGFEDVEEKMTVPVVKLNKIFTKEKLLNNWTRRVRWNEFGEGKVVCIISPDSQRIKSRIELLAYFKKAGITTYDIDYYFPKHVIKNTTNIKTLKKATGDSERGEQLSMKSTQKVDKQKLQKVKINKLSAGPRVKNVCRTLAQVLGKPRATFSKKLNKNGREEDDSVKRTKLLKKTQWCGKCSGCLKPNCRKCCNCLDMKKYGGPGSKKKPCQLRKCSNPRLSFNKRIINLDSSTSMDVSQNLSSDHDELPPSSQEGCTDKPIIDKWDSSIVDAEVIIPQQCEEVKKCTSSIKVNIDHWSNDSDGVAVVATENIPPLCLRCGSAGKEDLLYCSVCCEGYHPFCLDEGVVPQSDYEEMFWVCHRCTSCHTCGELSDKLLQCASCCRYYHTHCIGPDDHRQCYEFELPWLYGLPAELFASWPTPNPLYEVDVFDRSSVMSYENPKIMDLDSPDLNFGSDIVEADQFIRKRDDEYLYLGYVYIYDPGVNELSIKESRTCMLSDIVATLKYSTWNQMMDSNLVPEDYFLRFSQKDLSLESNYLTKQDLKRAIRRRRNELLEDYKTIREVESMKLKREKNKKRIKSLSSSPIPYSFFEEGNHKEPQSWEEFDSLFEQSFCTQNTIEITPRKKPKIEKSVSPKEVKKSDIHDIVKKTISANIPLVQQTEDDLDVKRRRRRTLGRASELASLRKSLLD